jgi:hypothetical protein
MGEVVAARYKTASGQSIPNNTGTIVNFNIKEYDTHNAVTTGTNWKFTAPVAGFYNISSYVTFAALTVTQTRIITLQILRNGVNEIEICRRVFSSESNNYVFPVYGSTDIKLNAGDEISIILYNDTGANRNLHNDAALVWVAIHKIS